MPGRIVVLWIGLLLAACAVGADRPGRASSGNLQLVDLTPDFERVWSRVSALPEPERATAFKAQFASLLPGFYDHRRFGQSEPAAYDRRLLQGLAKYPGERVAIEDISRRFAGLLAPARRRFEDEFGPMRGYPPIYLVNSLGEFDGGTRSLPGGARLSSERT